MLMGSKQSRNGIIGVRVKPSQTCDAVAEASRLSVRDGTPFTEKVVIEACLEIARRGLLVGLQDLGGAGLCCATSETASRGMVGLDLDLGAVPLREPGMEPFEILTSESQERVLAIVRPDDVEHALEICRTWGVLATPVATVKDGGNLT